MWQPWFMHLRVEGEKRKKNSMKISLLKYNPARYRYMFCVRRFQWTCWKIFSKLWWNSWRIWLGWAQQRWWKDLKSSQDSLDMVVGNTFFKDDEKLIIFNSGNCAIVIDYAVVQKEVIKKVKDIKVIPEEECCWKTKKSNGWWKMQKCSWNIERWS